MTYFKVLPQYDNKPAYLFKRGRVIRDGIFIGNELYTYCEISKYLGWEKYVIPVSVPKNKTYFFFGARFELNNE